jgi:pimeloyl-ACP methyl ester carboxylesterase
VWADELAARALDGRAVTLSAGAHMVPLTRPAELAAAIEAFLGRDLAERHDPRGAA